MKTQKGFLLSTTKYRDRDAVLHLFTNESGYESFFVKNAYGKRYKKSAYLSPFNELEIGLAFHQNKSSIRNISQIDLVNEMNCHQDVKLSSLIFFLSEFLHRSLRYEGKNEKIYGEILTLKMALYETNYSAYLIFLIKFLKIQGHAPLLSEGEFLDPKEGIFTGVQTADIFDREISALWKEILSSENAYSQRLQTKRKKTLLQSIMQYGHLHLPNFRIPVSLKIIMEVLS
ncbi:MAG: DNA repair protein RecO [Bergeyella sp.]|nr:DNA repair protein RecO [Bergeyella sp.]